MVIKLKEMWLTQTVSNFSSTWPDISLLHNHFLSNLVQCTGGIVVKLYPSAQRQGHIAFGNKADSMPEYIGVSSLYLHTGTHTFLAGTTKFLHIM